MSHPIMSHPKMAYPKDLRKDLRRSLIRGLLKGLLAVGILGLSLALSGHQVKVSEDVGGTLHIEPNDVARAGEPSQVWFALAQAGGKVIPLADCDCQLQIYRQAHVQGSPGTEIPLATPPLQPITAEGYANIPSAQVVFPEVGAYMLVLRGLPRNTADFQAFELSFPVTVAAAAQSAPPLPQETSPQLVHEEPIPDKPIPDEQRPDNQDTAKANDPFPTAVSPWKHPVILGGGVFVLGTISLLWVRRRKQSFERD